jgi:hypothetical protein
MANQWVQSLARGPIVKTLRIHTLDKGWHDKDEILLYAAFQVLVNFVENERPERVVDWNATTIHKQAWKEIKDLYEWWRKARPARRSPLDDRRLVAPPLNFRRIAGSEAFEIVEPDRRKYGAYYRALEKHNRLEEKWFNEDQRNLHRLIEIRGFLWT